MRRVRHAAARLATIGASSQCVSLFLALSSAFDKYSLALAALLVY